MFFKIHAYKTAIFLLLSFLVLGCSQKEEIKVKEQQAVPVKVRVVKPKDINKTLEYVGNIKAKDEVMVYPKVSGKIIEKVKGEGIPVKKGEAIAYIDRDEVGLKFNRAPIESPLTGVVGRIFVDIGSNINSQVPVALVLDMTAVKINLDMPEKYLPKIYLGQEAKVKVDAYPKQEFLGKVTQISPVVSLENRAAPIEITLENADALLQSGMFARVSLVLEERKNVPVILKEAIMGKAPDNYVYVVENNKAAVREITLGIHQGSQYEVAAGLRENDLVVVLGQQKLYDNAPVTVEMENN